jgi:hypothetical protein
MHAWFVEHLVCPTDHTSLQQYADHLVCASGPSYPVVDGFFCLNEQASDKDLMPFPYRLVVSLSELLRKTIGWFPALALSAERLHVRSLRRACPEDSTVTAAVAG